MMRIPGFSGAVSLYRSSGQYAARGWSTQVQVGVVPSAIHWGSLANCYIGCWGCPVKSNTPANANNRYSAILWGIPWWQSWENTCKNTPGPQGTIVAGMLPTRCVNTIFNIWGEWDIYQPGLYYCVTSG